MFVIGIVGGVASGKSKVAELLESFGAVTLDADQFGHEVLIEPTVKEAIRQRWGTGVFQPSGEVDRPALGRIVFSANPESSVELEQLEKMTHPRIGDKIDQQIERLTKEGITAAVLDAPVLLKAGWDRRCDKLLFVEAPESLRRDRAMERGWTEEEFKQREAAQTPIEEKRLRADVVIDNLGDLEETRRQVKAFWSEQPIGR